MESSPFNPSAVDKKMMLPSEMHKDSVEETPSVSEAASSVSATPGERGSHPVTGDGSASAFVANQFTPPLASSAATPGEQSLHPVTGQWSWCGAWLSMC